MFNYLDLGRFWFFIYDNVLRLNSEPAIKRFSNLIIVVAGFLKFSLISAGQLHSCVQTFVFPVLSFLCCFRFFLRALSCWPSVACFSKPELCLSAWGSLSCLSPCLYIFSFPCVFVELVGLGLSRGFKWHKDNFQIFVVHSFSTICSIPFSALFSLLILSWSFPSMIAYFVLRANRGASVRQPRYLFGLRIFCAFLAQMIQASRDSSQTLSPLNTFTKSVFSAKNSCVEHSCKCIMTCFFWGYRFVTEWTKRPAFYFSACLPLPLPVVSSLSLA